MPSPERGALVWTVFSPNLGHEQAGRRPAVVLSPKVFHDHSAMTVVCPITNRERGWPMEVKLPPDLAIKGVVLIDQIRSIDRSARPFEIVGQVPPEVLDEINSKLAPFLSI
jgi:mRNA interferase MazF